MHKGNLIRYIQTLGYPVENLACRVNEREVRGAPALRYPVCEKQ